MCLCMPFLSETKPIQFNVAGTVGYRKNCCAPNDSIFPLIAPATIVFCETLIIISLLNGLADMRECVCVSEYAGEKAEAG